MLTQNAVGMPLDRLPSRFRRSRLFVGHYETGFVYSVVPRLMFSVVRVAITNLRRVGWASGSPNELQQFYVRKNLDSVNQTIIANRLRAEVAI
jgi:hypothetical protein